MITCDKITAVNCCYVWCIILVGVMCCEHVCMYTNLLAINPIKVIITIYISMDINDSSSLSSSDALQGQLAMWALIWAYMCYCELFHNRAFLGDVKFHWKMETEFLAATFQALVALFACCYNLCQDWSSCVLVRKSDQVLLDHQMTYSFCQVDSNLS